MLYYILAALAWVAFRIIFRFEIIGKENLIKGRGFVLAPNHLAAIDPIFVVIGAHWTNKMRIFSKGELFEKNFLLTWFMGQIGCVPVRKGRDDANTIARTIEECKNGKGLLIFPEGTRSKTGETLPVKSGMFVVAEQAQVDIIPCRVIYDTPTKTPKLFCRVRVCYGEILPPPTPTKAAGKRNLANVKESKAKFTIAWNALYERNKF